ncbi:hypothetical protein FI667_g289, partial [Globisporangium splendens]
MTRQALTDERQSMLLDAREVGRGAAADADADASAQKLVAAFGAQRVAILLVHTAVEADATSAKDLSRRHGSGARITVFNTDMTPAESSSAASVGDANSGTKPLWVDLWPSRESVQAEVEEAGIIDGETQATMTPRWSLVWSPDGKYLVVSGVISNRENKFEACMWVYTCHEWMMALTDDKSNAAVSSPLLIQVHPEIYLPTRDWKAKKQLANGLASPQIMGVFFPHNKVSQVYFVSDDGLLVQVDVRVPKIALLTANDAPAVTASDAKALFQMKIVKRLTEWHASVTAVAFESNAATLVISGGLSNPSDALIKSRASSLSVWKMLEKDPFCDLLDYTMVLGRGDASQALGGDDAEESGSGSGTPSTTGLLTPVKKSSSLLHPFQFLLGGGATETQVLRGSIRELALSPNAVFVSMLDDQGRVSIRQIDACSDVLGWQLVSLSMLTGRGSGAHLRDQVGLPVQSVFWASADVLGFILENRRIVYGELQRHGDDYQEAASEDGVGEKQAVAAAIVILPVRYHFRQSPTLLDKDWTFEAVGTFVTGSGAGDNFLAYQLISANHSWSVNLVQNVELAVFVDVLMTSRRYDQALEVVEAYGMADVINLDTIHRQIWTQFRDQAALETIDSHFLLLSTEREYSGTGFSKALHHLNLIQDKDWVVDQCLSIVASDSYVDMNEILGAGLRALETIHEGVPSGQEAMIDIKRQKLMRYLYRLDTLKAILAEELESTELADDNEPPARVAEQYYDGAVFTHFRDASIVNIAKQLAREGRVESLTILFKRNTWNVIPHRLDILSLLPASIAPCTYVHLLPALGVHSEWQFYTLRKSSDFEQLDSDNMDDRETRVAEIEFNDENKSNDLDASEYALFELKARQRNQEREEEYVFWFKKRVLNLDSLFGQLVHAHELSTLASECLSQWPECDAKLAFREFQQHVERLYNCIYPLQLPTCCLLSLHEWSSFSVNDQISSVIGDWESNMGDAIDRIQAVFVAQRGDSLYALDDALSLLCRTLAQRSSLTALEFCAQLIHHSNPSMPLFERWIQNDALLLRTSIDVVLSATTSVYFGREEDMTAAQHGTFVEQLWVIFQSLPIRKDDDPPEIEQLQVEVDEMEDLMVTMDVLSKYGVRTSPRELKEQIGETGAAADDLLQRMCQFCLPGGEEPASTSNDSERERWMAVWQDATKLKTHVFGERISQEAILDVILRHLLKYDVYLDAAEHLVTNWIGSNHEVIHHAIVVLIRAVQTRIDALKGNFTAENDLKVHFAAVKCMEVVRHVLTFPSLEQDPARKTQYERQLRHETELVHACQLLDLLTYGAVKRSPADIRPLRHAKGRLDVVLQVFMSNPSNYKASPRAREWLKAHNQEQVVSVSAEPNSKTLEAVMYLAKLLRVDDHNHQITMKGAYAALYCADFDVAYGLTTEVVQDIQVGHHEREPSKRHHEEDVELQHLMSLVLDLVSASSFRSWTKKIRLCRLVFSAANVSPTSMFGHPITDLVMARMEKLEAIQALATELGLSEEDLEQRRAQESSNFKSSGAEVLLLRELEIVIDLLQEEKNDRNFLLRLLQKGFQLVYVMITSDVAQGSGTDGKDDQKQAEKIVQQMTRICLEDAIVLSSSAHPEDDLVAESSKNNWNEYLQLGFSYLLLWHDFAVDACDLEAFWENDIFPRLAANQQSASCSPAGAAPTQGNDVLLLREIHHFFMLQVASSMQASGEDLNDSTDLSQQLQGHRKKIEEFARSYDETKRFVLSKNYEPEAEGDDELGDESGITSTLTKRQNETRDVFLRLAKRCQEKMLSQKKTQELEEMNSFFNDDLDLEEFSRDAEYRTRKILQLATKKEHYHVAKQFAHKYGVDEYQCLLAYIRSVFLPDASHRPPSAADRHEQLEHAFRSDNEGFLEQALQKPLVFGHFLLNNDGTGVYELLSGTDHVGILLLLRMVLECSKRIAQVPMEEHHRASLFPLSKVSSDRITLLFMCLKRLKEVDPVESGPYHYQQVVDFKLVCAATSSIDLLTPPSANASECRKVAVAAILPFLNSKSIKMLTKILQKLHHVSTSAIILIHLSDMLKKIWLECRDRSSGLSGDLAAYAYESCMPFLSVLSSEHYVLFHCLFLGKAWEVLDMNVDEDEFYGQQMGSIVHFGALLAAEKRMELLSDALKLLQTRLDAWKASLPSSTPSPENAVLLESREKELRFLESELVEATFWFAADQVKTNRIVFAFDRSNEKWQDWEISMKEWFANDATYKAPRQQELVDLLVPLCEQVASAEIASLLVELALAASGSSASVANTLETLYRNVFANVVAENLLASGVDEWLLTITAEWGTAFPKTHTKESKPMERIARVVDTLCSTSAQEKHAQATYQHVLAQLDQLPTRMMKELAKSKTRLVQQNQSNDSAAQKAFIAEWRHLLERWDHEQNWARSAVLCRLMLDGGAAKSIAKQDLQVYEHESFGLRAKAVVDWLQVRSNGALDLRFALEMPTEDVYGNIAAVFSHVFVVLDASSSQGSVPRHLRQELTFTVANVLHTYDYVWMDEGSRQDARTWREEQKAALNKRIQDQFSIGVHDHEAEDPMTTIQKATDTHGQRNEWWSKLLQRGEWDGRRLVQWYVEMGYSKISEEILEEYVVAHWEAQRSVCLQFLLLSPFDELRTRHQDRILSSVRDQAAASGQVVELLMLRFDVQALLQSGLYQHVLAFHLNGAAPDSPLWTSSGEYLVCALVMMKEYATAARLACALWQVHPLLWDLENARLTLANYLKALAAARLPESDAADYEDAIRRHQVYGRTYNFFQREML